MKITFALFAAGLVATLAAQVPSLKPGQYEIVSEFAAPGGSDKMPPRKDQRCFTEKDVESVARMVGGRGGAEGGCHVVSSKTTGSTVTFTTECPSPDGRGGMTMTGKVDFLSSESYHAVVDMKMTGERGAPGFSGANVTMTAKRIGACAK